VGKKEFGDNSQLHKRQEDESRYLAATIWGRRGTIHRKAVSLKKGMQEEHAGWGSRANNLVGSKGRFTHLSEKQDPCWSKLRVSLLGRGEY